MFRTCLLMPEKEWSMSKGQSERSNLDDSAVMDSITSQWWSFSAFVPLLTGALWLWLASRSGLPAVLLGAVPGALLLGTGLSSLLWAGESRTLLPSPEAPYGTDELAGRGELVQYLVCARFRRPFEDLRVEAGA